jgi:nuclear pore complex protein Nup210
MPKHIRKGLASITLLTPWPAWMLWKHRDDCVFNGAQPSIDNVISKSRKKLPFGKEL